MVLIRWGHFGLAVSTLGVRLLLNYVNLDGSQTDKVPEKPEREDEKNEDK